MQNKVALATQKYRCCCEMETSSKCRSDRREVTYKDVKLQFEPQETRGSGNKRKLYGLPW